MSETLASSRKEKTSPPPFHVTLMDEEWAFEYGKGLQAKWPEWKEKTYEINGPPELVSCITDASGTPDDEFKRRLHQWYGNPEENEAVRQEIQKLQNGELTFNRGIAGYLKLQPWGFTIPEEYNVIVTPFSIGGGGAGQWLRGQPYITMRYNRIFQGDIAPDGSVNRQGRTRAGTLLHEAYHLGADPIMQKLLGNGQIPDDDKGKKYQSAKERIVDVCSDQVLVPGVLPSTFFQHESHPIDVFLAQRELPVPVRIQNYALSLKR